MLKTDRGGKVFVYNKFTFLKKLKANMESIPCVFLFPSKKLRQIQHSVSALQQALPCLTVHKILSLIHTEKLNSC